ncbi:hypothetical protein DXG01_013289 [Tephrocybe rancida]|nr:hypothetical protein DXG01_013289 [Tephrocybe rancida]
MALRSHNTSNKRARSPGSSGDRPNKRLSLTVDRFRQAHSSGNVTPQSPAGSSRFPSEDWVDQADGLTIDSPNVSGFGLPEDRDEDMNMDSDYTDSIPEDPPLLAQRPDLPPIQTAHMHFAHTLFRQHQQHTPLSATSSVPTPPGPLVTVLPPSPCISTTTTPVYNDVTPMQSQVQTQAPTRPATPVDDPAGSSAMLVSSPMGSFIAPRKQRFTMGPRADCMKCQMNVKGHSVHY